MAGKINKTGYTIINGMKLPAAAASYKIDYVLLKKLLKNKKFKCNKCNKIKSIKKFMKQKRMFLGYAYTCLECLSKRSIVTRNKWVSKNPYAYIKFTLKQNKLFAKKRGIKNDLKVEDVNKLYLDQKGLCALSGVKLTYIRGKGRQKNNISLDRINSSKDYQIKNIRLITDQLNRSTYNYSDKVIFKFAKLVIKNFK